MTTIGPQRRRLLLMVATQCRTMPTLPGLHDAARLLGKNLLDPSMGGCEPALPGASALLGGMPDDDEVTGDRIRNAISESARRAAEHNATLVLALLGHGFIPGTTPRLYLMGAEAVDQDRSSAVDVTQVLAEAADRPGIGGVIAIVDTCAAAAAVPSASELTSGIRAGNARLAVLAAAGVHQNAYDMRLSRALADLMSTGLATATARMSVAMLVPELAHRVSGQHVTFSDYAGGLAAAEELWLSHNRRRGGQAGREFAAVSAPATVSVTRPDDRSYRNMRISYLRWAMGAWRYIDLGDLGVELATGKSDRLPAADRIRRLPLEKMYISLHADPRSLADRRRAAELRRRDEADLDADVARTMSGRENDPTATIRNSRGSADSSVGGEGTSLEDAFARHRILVVLGHPGSGKSVMCLWLGSELAQSSRTKLLEDSQQVVSIPLKFRAADYAKYYAAQFANGDDPGGIAEFLAHAHAKDVGYPAHRLQGMFERALADGDAVILIDGLDELTDHREEVIDALVDVVDTYVAADPRRTNKVVITSRIAGYDDVRLTMDDVATYVIRPMSGEQTSTFVTSFFNLIKAKDQAPRLLQHLRASNETIRRLATTPLLLTSMCSYWHLHHELPASRSKLYRQLVVDTGYRWRAFSTADGESPLDDLLRYESDVVPIFLTMLSRIAARIHEEHADGQIGEEDLLETLDDALFGLRRFTDEDPRPIGLELIDRIREKVGIFAETGPGQFGFIHQTFREYLAGLDLLDRSVVANHRGEVSDELLFMQLAERIGDPRWREPILLALGECETTTRAALMYRALEEPDVDLEDWTKVVLAAALERPAAEADDSELTLLVAMAAQTYHALRATPDLVEDLDARLAELRSHLGPETFDSLALGLAREDVLFIGPVAGLYWRRRWLSSNALETFAASAYRDSATWDWPMHHALRLAAQPKPLREATVHQRLDRPSDENSEALRLYELGWRSWERQRRCTDEAVVAPLPTGILPIRELLCNHPDRWAACLTDIATTRVLCALFGGLDHHDTLLWSAEFEEFERLLQLSGQRQGHEIELRAAELVPRFDPEQITRDIAVLLDTLGGRVSPTTPTPVVDPHWMTYPSTAAIRDAVQRWLDRAPGDPDSLRLALNQLATPETTPADRAEAELGLLILDKRPMTPDAASVWTLRRVLESAGDATIRGHSFWFSAIWSPTAPLTNPERAVLHRFLLRIAFLVADRAMPLRPDPLSLDHGSRSAHPILIGDYLARQILAQGWGHEEPAYLGIETVSPQELLSALAWLTTLPYTDASGRVGPAHRTMLWHESMPRAELAVPGGLRSMLRPLLAWTLQEAPQLETQLSAAVRAALTRSSDPVRPPETLPPPVSELRELYDRLGARRHVQDLPGRVKRIAEQLPGPHTDLAYLLIAFSRTAAEPRPQWQLVALDLLAAEPDQGVLAEALSRMRGDLCDDAAVQDKAEQLIATIRSPVLRAEASGSLAQTADALIDLVGASASPAVRIGLSIVARACGELARFADLARDAAHPVPVHEVDEKGDQPHRTFAWYAPLTPELLAAVAAHLSSGTTAGEQVADVLSCVSGIEESAVTGLTELLEGTQADEPWVGVAHNLLALHRMTTEPAKPGDFGDLVEMIWAADAVTAAKARLLLLGPFGNSNRDTRMRRLSEQGLERWWELGVEAVNELDPARWRLYWHALQEWEIDDVALVREATRRADRDEHERAVLLELLPTMAIWRTDAQLALAEWLDTLTADQSAAAYAALSLVSMLKTAENGLPVTEELEAATVRACVRSRLSVRITSGLTTLTFRLGVAQAVAEACLDAMADPDSATPTVAAARAHFWARTRPVISTDEAGNQHADFTGFGYSTWTVLGSRPADVAQFAPAELNNEIAIKLLVGWLCELDGEDIGRGSSTALARVTFEAVLNLLVVLSAREDRVFKLQCAPELMQPIFSRPVVENLGDVARVAGLILLGRLRFVDLEPTEGPNLTEVMNIALRSTAEVRVAAFNFLETVRHVRGDSLADGVLELIARSPNESVAQGFARLAVAYLKSPTCSHTDRRRIRSALQADLSVTGGRRSVYLVGMGSVEDPIRPVVGPDRRTEFRRLLRQQDSPSEW